MIELAFNNLGFEHLPEAAPYKARGVPGMIAAAHDYDFGWFQYTISGAQDPRRFEQIDAAALALEVERTGVRLSLHHHAFDLLTLYHFAERDAYSREFCAFVDAALEFIARAGGDLVSIHPPQINAGRDRHGGYADAGLRRRAADAFRDPLLRMGEHAARLGLRLGLEAICFDEPFPGGSAFRGVDELDAFMQSADFPPSVGLLIDTTHFHHKGIDPCQVLRLWRGRVIDLHVSDAVVHQWVDPAAYLEKMPGEVHLPVGAGTTDFAAIVRTLKEIGYDRRLTLELYPRPVKSLDDVIRTRDALRGLLAQS